MSDRNWEKIESIIDHVLTLPEEKRELYVNYKCQGDNALKSEVTQLLESIFDSEGWLENPAEYREEVLSEMTGEGVGFSSSGFMIGDEIDAYQIKQKLGEGGMGSVYLAERADGEFEHQVAVKVIRNEKASAENIRRFEQERNILAGLSHPGIASLFDGGVTEDGFPYLVMEYVEGIPIDQYCQNNGCTISERIALFKQVLKAVRHAHENLVVHRDLKPGNILVDDSGRVKILDFGISKLLQENDAPGVQLTQTNARLLTPRYAAPEQILQLPITTATDIYALGVIFYKLLSDTYPYDLDGLSRFKMEQRVLEAHPSGPSQNVVSPKLRKELRGDLDAIALKAIRKEPDQRYRIANEFLDDLERYDMGLPVLAHEGSMTYRLKKFAKRNKSSISIAAAFILCLGVLTVVYTLRLNQQRMAAEQEAQKALEVKNLLLDLFESNDPILAEEESVTLAGLLEAGTSQILNKSLDAGVKSELLLTLSTIYQNISEHDKARRLAEQSLQLNVANFGSGSLNAAKSQMRLGSIEQDLGNFEEGKEYFLKAKEVFEEQIQVSDPLLAKLYSYLGDSEEQLSNYTSSALYFQQALDVISAQADVDTAIYIAVLRDAARSRYLTHFHNVDVQEADSLYQLALGLSEEFYGENHINTSSVFNDIGMFYMTQARYDESRAFYNRSIAIKDAVYGDKAHVNYASTLNNLAVLEKTWSNFEVAESLFVRTLDMDIEIYGENHPNVAMSKHHLADIYFKTENYLKSRKFIEEALSVYLEYYGPEHSYMGSMYRDYGQLLSVQGEYARAEGYLIKSDSIYTEYVAPGDSRFARLYHIRGENYYRMSDYDKAIPFYERAAKTYDHITPQYYFYRRMAAKCRIRLGQCYMARGERARADSVFQILEIQIDTTEALATSSEIKELYNDVVNNR